MGNTSSLSAESLKIAYESGTSAYRLAKDYGCSIWSVITRLRQADVRLRPDGVSKKLTMNPEQERRFQSLNAGILLGDGSINGNTTTRREKCFLRMEQSDRRKGWLDWLQSEYKALGVHANVIPIKKKKSPSKMKDGRIVLSGPSHLFYTGVSDEFRSLREQWYPGDGKKIVPSNLKLDPLSIAMWFCGDGSAGTSGSLTFYTNGFTYEEVQFLSVAIRYGIGVRTSPRKHVRPGEWTLKTIGMAESVKLRDAISPFVPECCLYKFSGVRHPMISSASMKARALDVKQVLELRRMRNAGKSLSTIARHFGVSTTCIHGIAVGRTYKADVEGDL